MIKYQENRNDITQSVEVDLTEIPAPSRGDLESKITEYLKYKDKSIFRFDAGNKLIYETEVLTPKVNKSRLNVLMVLGNPAVHSVAERMFFSYERTPTGKRREHRFWRALRDCGVLKFRKDVKEPTTENNDYKRCCLLNGEYESDFNIFLLPYFSFPTPASRKCKCNGVSGIRKIVGGDIFEKMKEFEFQRFEKIVLCNDIKNVICFQKTAREEIVEHTRGKKIDDTLDKPVYKLGGALKHVILYAAKPTGCLHTDKCKGELEGILSDVRTKNRIG